MEMHDCFCVCVCVWHHKAMLVLFRFDNYFLSCAVFIPAGKKKKFNVLSSVIEVGLVKMQLLLERLIVKMI